MVFILAENKWKDLGYLGVCDEIGEHLCKSAECGRMERRKRRRRF